MEYSFCVEKNIYWEADAEKQDESEIGGILDKPR